MLRVIGARVPDVARLAGIDLNPGMLEVARSLSATSGIACEWHQGDVAAMPFGGGEFSICFCQQGLQFFPDRQAALAEMHRMLEPGGILALSVWGEISPLFAAMSKALATHIGSEAAECAEAPFAFRDRELIAALLENAGFTIRNASSLTVERKIGPAEISFAREIAGSPVAAFLDGFGADIVKLIIADMADSLLSYRVADGFVIPQVSNLFNCSKA